MRMLWKMKIARLLFEPIGAGEKVYHLTACNWVRAYAPLVCSDEIIEGGEGEIYKKSSAFIKKEIIKVK